MPVSPLSLIGDLDRKVHWLSAWTIHHANHLRDSRDGLKVGGHQASSASLATILSALYFGVLRPQDRVAVKPHASPAFHAIQYLHGRQTRDQLENFRAYGGAQSYPSRTKDKDDVDFSTGSVGLGVAMTAFASIVQDYLEGQGALTTPPARMIALMGDAELDEGNVYEALIEGTKHDLRNCWWIIDYNRQSLDATTSDRMFQRFDEIFRACAWDVITLKYGRLLQDACNEPGGQSLRAWLDGAANDLYSALTFQGGAAWRTRLNADIGHEPGVTELLARRDDDELAALMTNLAGHDLGLLLETFAEIDDERPKVFIIYTIKGIGLPFQGHKDNHAGLMTAAQMQALQARMNVPEGREWERFAGLPLPAETYEAFIASTPFAGRVAGRRTAAKITVPSRESFPRPMGRQSTQMAFGKILHELARQGGDLADAIVTASPDVTVSTNLGGWVNQRGLFARVARSDLFRDSAIPSPQKWGMGPRGQHIELGIAEHNLFLLLGAAGLAADLFGKRLLPVGTLYDPFINRGLDALNYACYQDARFLLVATPSGIALGPEGGAHQSIHTPLIGMAQPGLTYFEPAHADELSEIMRWAFAHMQEPHGGSVYLRLSTRPLDQPDRVLAGAALDGLLKGAYWHVEPAPGCELAIVYAGAVAPEALQAFEQILEDDPGAGLLAVPSADALHRDWCDALAARATGERRLSHVEILLSSVASHAGLVTVVDGPPATLSWLGGVRGHRVAPLGVQRFGQCGAIPDLYRAYRLDSAAILDAAASVLTTMGTAQ